MHMIKVKYKIGDVLRSSVEGSTNVLGVVKSICVTVTSQGTEISYTFANGLGTIKEENAILYKPVADRDKDYL